MMREERIGRARQEREVRIYALCKPGGVEPRYVGKTVYRLGVRHKDHLYRSLRKQPRLPVHRWIASLYRRELWSCIKLIEIVPPDQDWAAREKYWIKRLRDEGHDLLNLTEGGDGLHGHIRPQSVRDKIAAANKTGRHFSCERCGAQFWRKQYAIKRGENRFCSRECYFASLRGVSRPMPAAVIERGVAAAARLRKARTHCKRNHPLSGENLFINTSGSRGCKECRKLHKLAYRERRRG